MPSYLYERLQRKGYLLRDCQRLINQDRNHFGASHGGAGRRRRHGDRASPATSRSVLDDVRQVIDPKPGQRG